jgi:RecA/RadA recombinase
MAKSKGKKFKFSEIGSIIDDITKKKSIIVEDESDDFEYISTGIYILNACLSSSIYGGLRRDVITVFAGPESSGKTFLALNSIRKAQEDDYFIIYIDTENSISRKSLTNYGIRSTKDDLKLLKTNKVEDINMTLTQFLDEMKSIREDGGELPKMMIVLDSLAQMASNKEKEDLISGKLKQDMTKAKAIGSFFRSITMDLALLKIPLIVNNQTYQTMDLFPQEVMKGGRSLYYSASNITFLSKAKLKTGEEDENDFQSGIIVTAKAIKNRQAKPKKVKFEIDFGKGCNPYVGLDMFCIPRFFDQIGVSKGKYVKFDKPKEVVDKITGEVTLKEGEMKDTGNRYYVRHLDKYFFKKQLFTPEVFTKEVLDAIDPIAQAYFSYSSMDEIEEYNKQFEEQDDDSDYKDADEMDTLSTEDFFDDED